MNYKNDGNSYKELKKPFNITCDFCEKEFHNRYESIIHNASHIIIPLWIQTFYKCHLCDSYSATVEECCNHKSQHSSPKINQNGIKTTDTDCQINNFTNDNLCQINGELKVTQPIRNRIQFEEDPYSKDLINDLITECQVNIHLLDEPWTLDHEKQLNGVRNGDVIKEYVYPSISYSILMKPGIFSCKYCSASYPNRFSLIKHEKYHMKIDKGKPNLCVHCDRFIAGSISDLNKHQEKHHPLAKSKKLETYICKKCGLKFRKYKRHARHYHIHDCQMSCRMKFDNAKQLADRFEQNVENVKQNVEHVKQDVEYGKQDVEHVKQDVEHGKQDVDNGKQNVEHRCNVKTKILNICDLCYSFLKRRSDLKYYLVGETDDELGVRYPCDNCGKKFFVLKIVKRVLVMKKMSKDHRNKTNEERLKSIQHRFKKLNLLNKFYSVV